MSPKSTNKNKKKNKKQKRKKKKESSFFLRVIKWSLVLGLWVGIVLTILTAWYAAELPKITKSPQFERHASLTIKGNDGVILARYGSLKGASVSVADLPPYLIYAIIATEDRRFYQHHGIDPAGLARAVLVDVKEGHFAQGGSTITQQLAKNLFLSHERKVKRKIQEALLALWLEKHLTKDEILSAYLNRVYLGSGTYGVEAAAQLYFNKSAKNVNLRESAILAGLLKAPTRYSPLRNPRLSAERANVVLNVMHEAGYITEEKRARYQSSAGPILSQRTGSGHGSGVRYFTDRVTEELNDLLGTPDKDLVIETTLDPVIQAAAEKSLGESLRKNGKSRRVSQGAVLVMDSEGGIVAMVGGRDYRKSQFNRSTQALRPPGSAFKPVVYLAALEEGRTPQDIIKDAPITEGEYKPKNFNDKYLGDVTLETALSKSLNTATVRLAHDTGIGKIIHTARSLNIKAALSHDLSLALGSSGVPLLEMVGAYAILAGGGQAVYPYMITRVTNSDGRVLYERSDIKLYKQLVDRKAVKRLNGMLRETIETGTGRRAKLPFRTAGKTGTSQDFRDALFIGYTNRYVAGVWMGNDDNTPMNGVTGGTLPAQIWKETILTAHEKKRTKKSGERPAPSFPDSSITSDGFSSLLKRLLLK